MRAVSAKALYILLLYMLLPFQGDHHLHEITQGAATLYPGLCAAALTARADYYICCKQVVNRNQETTFCKGLRSKVYGQRSKD